MSTTIITNLFLPEAFYMRMKATCKIDTCAPPGWNVVRHHMCGISSVCVPQKLRIFHFREALIKSLTLMLDNCTELKRGREKKRYILTYL